MLCLSGNAAALQSAAAVAVSAASSLGSVIVRRDASSLNFYISSLYFLDEFPSTNPTGGGPVARDPAELPEPDRDRDCRPLAFD